MKRVTQATAVTNSYQANISSPLGQLQFRTDVYEVSPSSQTLRILGDVPEQSSFSRELTPRKLLRVFREIDAGRAPVDINAVVRLILPLSDSAAGPVFYATTGTLIEHAIERGNILQP